MAILAAQEIACLSHVWGNAVVAVEDLGWISNTMSGGRWNRGVFVRWLARYVSQGGGWVVAVNPSHTSQRCYKCGARVSHPTHGVSVCPARGAMGRGVNAASNVVARAVPRVAEVRTTRAKNRKFRPQQLLRTPAVRSSLKYPGRDRAKHRPAAKRENRCRTARGVILPVCPARAQAPCLDVGVLADQDTRGIMGVNMAALKRGNMADKSRLCYLV